MIRLGTMSPTDLPVQRRVMSPVCIPLLANGHGFTATQHTRQATTIGLLRITKTIEHEHLSERKNSRVASQFSHEDHNLTGTTSTTTWAFTSVELHMVADQAARCRVRRSSTSAPVESTVNPRHVSAHSPDPGSCGRGVRGPGSRC